MSAAPKKNLLITGASGGLTHVLTDLLKDRYHFVGIDPRRLPMGRRFPGEFYQVDYTHRRMNEIFQKHKFDAIIHMGRIRTTADMSKTARYNLNVLGTRNILQLAQKFSIGKVVVFSTFHVYGAYRTNHLYIREDEPLRASQIFPELSDAVELDTFSLTFMFQHPEVKTVILRPVNVIGAKINNEISKMLRSEYCPQLLGFDPMMQFIDARDVAKAISLSLDHDIAGVFNVAGEGVIPYAKAIEIAGATSIPFPHTLFYSLVDILGKLKILRVPRHLVDYIRFPVIVSDELFRKAVGYRPDVSTVDALESLKVRVPSVID